MGKALDFVLSPISTLLGDGGTSTVNVTNPTRAVDLLSDTSSQTPETASINTGDTKKKGKSALTINKAGSGGNYTGLNI
jgi:hypothetical protein